MASTMQLVTTLKIVSESPNNTLEKMGEEFCAKYIKWLCLHMIFNLLLCSKPQLVTCTIIKSLPGFPGSLPFKLETGYIGVDEKEDVQLFYYFVESERNPRDDPLMLWLTGGPTCSGLSGLAFEIGPMKFNMVEYNGSLPTFVINPYSWTKVSSIIFVDAPIGTGFSYSRSSEGSGDTFFVNHIYSFVKKVLKPEAYQKSISKVIYLGTHRQILILMQIQGFHLPIALHLYQMNSTSQQKRVCRGLYTGINQSNKQCAMDLQAFSVDYKNLLIHVWVNDDNVQKALHVHNRIFWMRCNSSSLPYRRYFQSVVSYHLSLNTRGYRALIYSGDHDMLIPYLGTLAWIRSLNFTVVHLWRPWLGGGHTAPEYKPKECFAMFKRWISQDPL
ncbi:serine carboxypeptidase-like 18 isoform X3 [Prunus yedoensis var. nudiflora]|uniref:Serine carboxypeptidase-like 18 isoform X3 n=1 Tax=Prunus yedoensis var. nudiflora TaxID=2094558 RepID=A0A314UI63_PRUYE|nr:serine carboxypeptidase-like 18 isoform X3 [Prunus yedoensis var. nudiflora]